MKTRPIKGNTQLSKDLRVSGCGICGCYIFATQKRVWTRYVGLVHEDKCLDTVKEYERRTQSDR